MALDTTIGGASSDSYVTLAEYVAYVTANIDGAYTSTDEVIVRRACQYLDRNNTFRGYRVTSTQAREWPRSDVGYVDGYDVPSTDIPQRIKDAQCELAYAMSQGADPYATISEGAVQSETATAGPVSTTKTYFNAKQTPSFPAVAGLLRGYTLGGNGQVRLMRG